MAVLIGIALKSLLIAGITLGALRLLRNRSAAERSWVAHIGLLALVIMAVAPLVIPKLAIETPALVNRTEAAAPLVQAAPVATPTVSPTSTAIAQRPVAAQPVSRIPSINTAAAATAVYAVPAAILLILTLLALARLIALRARADVLVDGHWLSALARAQRRMGFKHGTALLTSNDLASPISWGLMRPVILLNSRAVEATGEAEAIIAHELAHVARMDWIKLLLARVATALFWFNPLVWMLAREAHQLREEAADDSVLAADIVDTDYAQLLVGVARHECPGLLLGAHGVAPSKNSLARRVARVLDGKSARGPVARSFAVGVFVGAVAIAAPLAALTLTPAKAPPAKSDSPAAKPWTAYPVAMEEPADLPHIIARGVSTSVAAASTVIAPSVRASHDEFVATAPNGTTVQSTNGTTVARAPNGATVTMYPPDAQGRRRVVAVASNGATAVSYADAGDDDDRDPVDERAVAQKRALDRAIELKAIGATPEYVASIKSVAPQLRLTSEDIVQLKGVGVTPEFIQELARQGYSAINAGEITEAYAVGVRSDYIRAMAAAGYPRIPLRQLTELKAVGVTPADVERFRRAGFTRLDVNDLVQAKTLGLTPEEIRATRDP